MNVVDTLHPLTRRPITLGSPKHQALCNWFANNNINPDHTLLHSHIEIHGIHENAKQYTLHYTHIPQPLTYNFDNTINTEPKTLELTSEQVKSLMETDSREVAHGIA